MYKSIIINFSLWLALIVIVGCACTQKITYDSPKILKNITRSIVKISIDYIIQDKITLVSVQKGFLATGFSIATTDTVSLILTNQHVCNMRKDANYTLTLQSGKEVKAEFIRSDEFADICLLKANDIIPPLTMAKQNGSQGDRITTIGGPDGVFPLIVDGIISGYHNVNMGNDFKEDGFYEVHFRAQISSAPIYPGSSGSPVMNINGEVIGIVFAVRGEKEHISYIVPIGEVWRFLNTQEYVYTN